MILGKDDIKAIADEVLRRLIPVLNSTRAIDHDRPNAFAVQRELEILRQKSRDWIAEKERLDKEIRDNSTRMPPESRPRPEQYKSIPRKKDVLELIKDPDRWAEIQLLPIQWPNRRKGKPTD